jgi:hypothetical protein
VGVAADEGIEVASQGEGGGASQGRLARRSDAGWCMLQRTGTLYEWTHGFHFSAPLWADR